MPTELARAFDEELAAHGVRAGALDSAHYTFALLALQSLAAHLEKGDVPTDAIDAALSSAPSLADVGEDQLHRTDYLEVKKQLQRAFGADATSHIRAQVDRLVTTGSLANGLVLTKEDHDALADFMAARMARRQARASWEQRVGALLSHAQVLALTGWSKQALSQAVREHRVLRLAGSGNERFYAESAFDDADPARPLPGAKRIFGIWAKADPKGWTTASWLMSPQVELSGRTPREAMLDPEVSSELVLTLAQQAIDRLEA